MSPLPLCLPLVFALLGCRGSDPPTQPKPTGPANDPITQNEGAGEPDEPASDKRVVVEGIDLPAGVTVFDVESGPAVEGHTSKTHYGASRRAPAELESELTKSLDPSFARNGDNTGWQSAKLRTSVLLVAPTHPRAAHLANLPAGSKSIVIVTHSPKPTPCPPCGPDGATLPGCSCP